MFDCGFEDQLAGIQRLLFPFGQFINTHKIPLESLNIRHFVSI